MVSDSIFVIWHDNDYEIARWIYENPILKDKN